MKGMIHRVLRLGVVVVILIGVIVGVPASADVGSAVVVLSNDEISGQSQYTITFSVSDRLGQDSDQLYIIFPGGTDINAITDSADGDAQVAASSGMGAPAFMGVTTGLTAIVGTVLFDFTVLPVWALVAIIAGSIVIPFVLTKGLQARARRKRPATS